MDFMKEEGTFFKFSPGNELIKSTQIHCFYAFFYDWDSILSANEWYRKDYLITPWKVNSEYV